MLRLKVCVPPTMSMVRIHFHSNNALYAARRFFLLLLHRSPDCRSLLTFLCPSSTDSASPEIIHSLLLVHFGCPLKDLDFLAWCQVSSYSQLDLYRPSKVSTISQNAENLRIRERGSRSHESRRCPRSRATPPHQ